MIEKIINNNDTIFKNFSNLLNLPKIKYVNVKDYI